jgi:hypothetical protein
MAALEDAYAAWRGAPFPPGSTDDEVDEIHADLVLADTWVAESVIPYVERAVYEPAKADVLGTLRELRSRSVALADGGSDDRRTLVASYLHYVGLLEEVYRAFIARK